MMNQPQNRPQLEPFTAEQVQRAIREGGRALVELAERVGRQARNQGLTTNQIRNIFGLVKRIEMEMRKGSDWQHELAMLKPKMAYAAARAKDKNKKDTGAETLARVLSLAIDEVGSDDSKFARFVDLFEAILAYHKAAGGR
jgi:CRISPR-associated protein Csm2